MTYALINEIDFLLSAEVKTARVNFEKAEERYRDVASMSVGDDYQKALELETQRDRRNCEKEEYDRVKSLYEEFRILNWTET